jgi:hypothetical protein
MEQRSPTAISAPSIAQLLVYRRSWIGLNLRLLDS